MLKKLAIVGSHPGTRDNAPWNDGDFDIWVFNEAAMANPKDTPSDPAKQWCKRWDACFQMHKPEIYTSPYNRSNAGHWEWLQKQHLDRPIYMQSQDVNVPNSVVYPLEEAIALTGEKYFTSSFAYALALAALQGRTYIEIYGSDLVSNTEYSYQAECFKFWIAFLRGRGITVVMKCWDSAFASPLYGYEGDVQLGAEYYRSRANKTNAEWQSADKNLSNVRRAIEKHIGRGEWEKVKDLILSYQDAALQCGQYAGAMSEAERYAAYGERAIYRQEYEFSMAKSQRDGEQKKIMMYHVGGMVEYVWNIVKQTNNPKAINQLTEFLLTMGRHAYDAGAMKGVFTENEVYMGTFDRLVRAAGGQKSIEVILEGAK
jgi:hypothetical protein